MGRQHFVGSRTSRCGRVTAVAVHLGCHSAIERVSFNRPSTLPFAVCTFAV